MKWLKKTYYIRRNEKICIIRLKNYHTTKVYESNQKDDIPKHPKAFLASSNLARLFNNSSLSLTKDLFSANIILACSWALVPPNPTAFCKGKKLSESLAMIS